MFTRHAALTAATVADRRAALGAGHGAAALRLRAFRAPARCRARNYRDGAHLAADEINAAGGILGKQIEMTDYDTQTDPQTSRALVQKAIDEGAYVDHRHGLFRARPSSTCWWRSRPACRRSPASEAPNITQQGNPYIFRTSSGAAKGVPALTRLFQGHSCGAKKIAVAWVNNDFGKGGHDVFIERDEGGRHRGGRRRAAASRARPISRPTCRRSRSPAPRRPSSI